MESSHPVDKGWAWACVLGGFVNFFCVTGSSRASGILFVEIEKTFPGSSSLSAVMFGLQMGSLALTSLLYPLLSRKITDRQMAMFGGVCLALSYSLLSLATDLYYVVLVFGFLNEVPDECCLWRLSKMASNSDIKSNAVVKFSALEMPAEFLQLQRDTNLNVPPAKWLQGGTKWDDYLRNVSFGKEHSFSSFKMAHLYPDLMGDIDVVSDSENIKKLLKIPFSKDHVSMMVHRVGNTLLLEDFDVHKHLLRQQKKDWQWLRKFYYDTIIQSMQEDLRDKCVVRKKKSRDHLQHQNMFSKFLYYSIGQQTPDKPEDHFLSSHGNDSVDALNTSTQTCKEESDKPEGNSEFQRNSVWTFEDIRMLIGADLPIFGGRTHPCVSLRLRDMQQPINVLTGLDYWLDNLMCNVPELAMCYHLQGIVQSYELIKTEDIPRHEKFGFDHNVVKDIAQNILSFLKSNATKEGHTYWLFKGQGDDVVKLYDLSTLCDDVTEDRRANPFTVPVGMLLYRVARNMRQREGRKKSGTIRTLLKNCLLLLDKEAHSQFVTSALFLLSDLYVSDNIHDLEMAEEDTESDAEEGVAEEEGESGEAEWEERPSTSVDVEALWTRDKVKAVSERVLQNARYPPVSGSVEERSKKALSHIVQGLCCVDDSLLSAHSQSEAQSQHEDNEEEEQQETCNPSKPIPLHYKPIRKQRGATPPSRTASPDPFWTNQDEASAADAGSDSQVSVLNLPPLSASWHTRSKSLLLRKAAIAYYGLAEAKLGMQKYGFALKYAKQALCCFSAMKVLNSDMAGNNLSIEGAVLGVAGDAFLLLAKANDFTVHKENFSYVSEEENAVLNSAGKELLTSVNDYPWLECLLPNVRQNLQRSATCYKLSLELYKEIEDSEDRIQLVAKRYGNVQNELGVYCMNQAGALLAEQEDLQGLMAKEILSLMETSRECLLEGIKAFDSLEDNLNAALLCANLGRLMRLGAQREAGATSGNLPRGEFSYQERHYYIKAQDSYNRGLHYLGQRSAEPDVWDSISWELSSAYFSMATLLQDHAPLSVVAQEQVEKEVGEVMQKALQHCRFPRHSRHLAAAEGRVASIHHRLASLYHNAVRNQIGERQRKQRRLQAEDHYQKAFECFQRVNSPYELLRVQLERVALCEYLLQNQTSPVTKARTLQQALSFVLDCNAPLLEVAHQMAPQLTANQSEAPEAGQVTLPNDCAGADVSMATNSGDAASERSRSSADAGDALGTDDEDLSHVLKMEKILTILQRNLQFILLNLVKSTATTQQQKSHSAQKQVSTYKEMYMCVLESGLLSVLPVGGAAGPESQPASTGAEEEPEDWAHSPPERDKRMSAVAARCRNYATVMNTIRALFEK